MVTLHAIRYLFGVTNLAFLGLSKKRLNIYVVIARITLGEICVDRKFIVKNLTAVASYVLTSFNNLK